MEKIKYESICTYLDALEGREKEMMFFFVDYMRMNHPEIEEVFSFQMPTYILGRGKKRNYIAFSTNKNHFSLHSLDFDYISNLKSDLTNPGKGKGCVHIPYHDEGEKKRLIRGIEDIIQRNRA